MTNKKIKINYTVDIMEKKNWVSMPVTKTKNTGYLCLSQRQKTLGIYSCDKDKKHWASMPVTKTKNTGYLFL